MRGIRDASVRPCVRRSFAVQAHRARNRGAEQRPLVQSNVYWFCLMLKRARARFVSSFFFFFNSFHLVHQRVRTRSVSVVPTVRTKSPHRYVKLCSAINLQCYYTFDRTKRQRPRGQALCCGDDANLCLYRINSFLSEVRKMRLPEETINDLYNRNDKASFLHPFIPHSAIDFVESSFSYRLGLLFSVRVHFMSPVLFAVSVLCIMHAKPRIHLNLITITKKKSYVFFE